MGKVIEGFKTSTKAAHRISKANHKAIREATSIKNVKEQERRFREDAINLRNVEMIQESIMGNIPGKTDGICNRND